MGMADIAEVLWNDFLKHNPQNPQWINRDRFILSNGHGSMLHTPCCTYLGMTSACKICASFVNCIAKRQDNPEVGITPGIETTTGPLGQRLCQRRGHGLGGTQFSHTV